ncbi:MAG: SDR family NAD(P)-dependent oxidoreductase [bacterium]
MRIRDRVFVVTGAGSGIGQAVTLDLLSRGGRVAAVDLREEGLAETMALASAPPQRLTTYELNVADRAAVEALPERVLADHGQVDGLLCIAGIIQRFVPIDEMEMDEIERIMAVNFWGTLYLDLAFLPLLERRPEACLVNVASMGALVPVPGQGIYGASKGAVKLLTEGLYAELRDSNVAVTVVFPGGTATHISETSGVQVPSMGAGTTPKLTSAEDAARQIVEAVQKGTFRVVIGGDARMLDRLSRLSPQRAIAVVADRMKSLLG